MTTTWVHPMRSINRGTHYSVRLLGLLGLIALLGGCGNIPEVDDDQTMRAIYDRHTLGGATDSGSSGALTPDHFQGHSRLAEDSTPPRMSRYTRSVATETDNLFPRLPNPTLYLYVRPHTVGQDGLPIPGYTVPFKMYERDRHAMPGERLPSDSAPALPVAPGSPLGTGGWYE